MLATVNAAIPARRHLEVQCRIGPPRRRAAPAGEFFMRTFASLLAASGILALCLMGGPPALAQPKPGEQGAQPPGQPSPAPAGSPAVSKFSVVTQSWHRYPGLAVADITFENRNDFAVRNAVVTCEFFDLKGKLVAARASTVFQRFPPGKKKIEGIEFSLREKNAVPGSCRVLSVNTGGSGGE
jgi:hypothetical protein